MGKLPRHTSAAAAVATEEVEVAASLIAWVDGTDAELGPESAVGRFLEVPEHGRGLVVAYARPVLKGFGTHTLRLQSGKSVSLKLRLRAAANVLNEQTNEAPLRASRLSLGRRGPAKSHSNSKVLPKL